MLNITNYGKIELTRGDTFEAPLFLNQGNKVCPIRYELTSADTLYFALMEPNQRFEDAILKKVFTKDSNKDTVTGDILIQLRSSDTTNLLPGKYYYTIKLATTVLGGEPIINTVVPESEFYLMR